MSAKAELAPPTLTSSPAVEAWATSRSGPSATSSAAFEVGALAQVDADAGAGAVLGEDRRGDRVDAHDAAQLVGERGQLALLDRCGAGDVDIGGVGGAGGEGALDVLVRLRGLGVGGSELEVS